MDVCLCGQVHVCKPVFVKFKYKIMRENRIKLLEPYMLAIAEGSK